MQGNDQPDVQGGGQAPFADLLYPLLDNHLGDRGGRNDLTERLDGHGTAEFALRVNGAYGKTHAVALDGSLSSVVRRKYATAVTAVRI
jgi:hypothetical protein